MGTNSALVWHRRAATLLVAAPLLQIVNVTLVADAETLKVASNVLQSLAALVAAAVLLKAAQKLRAAQDRAATGWTIVSLSSCLFAAGVVSFMFVEVILRRPPYPGFPEVFFLAVSPTMVAGILRLPREPISRRERWDNGLDLGAFALVAGMVVWHFNLQLLLAALRAAPTPAVLASLAYTALDSALLLVLFHRLVLRLGQGQQFEPMLLLVLGGFCLITADLLQGNLVTETTFASGSPIDLGWLLFGSLTGWAGLHLLREPVSRTATRLEWLRTIWTVGITYSWIAVAVALLFWAVLHQASVYRGFMLAGVAGAVVLALWRQVRTLRDNFELMDQLRQAHDELEHKVAERTEELHRNQDELRRSAAFRQFAFDSLRVPIVVMDAATWQYVDCNPSAVEVYGYTTREEVLGKTPVDVSAPYQYDGQPSAEAAAQRISEALAAGSTMFEWRHQRPNGEVWDGEVRLMPFQAGEHQLLQFTLQDITASKQAADLLEQERIFTHAVMDSVPGLLYLYDGEGHLIRWNKQHELLTGFSAEELNGKHVLTWYDEPDRSRIIEAIGEVYQAGRSSAEVNLLTKDRGPVPFLVTGQRLTLAGKEYLTGIGIELTERRLAEKARQESQEELDRILRTVPDVIYRLDAQGRTTFVNEAVRTYGYDPAAMLGRSMLEFVADEDRERAVHHLDERRTGARATKSFELRLLPANGPACTFEVRSDALTSAPVFLVDAAGLYSTDQPTTASFLGTQGIARDITQRKRAEEALRESEEKFRSLFVQAADASYLIQDEHYIDCNDEALRLYDCDRAALIGSTPADWSPEYQSDGQPSVSAATARMEQALRDGHCRFAWTHRRRDGSPVETEVTLTCVGLAGQPVLFATVRDVTAARQSERERAKLQAQLTQAQKMESVGRLAGGVAHDFNNMLNVVYGHAEMALLEVPADSAIHRDLEEIYTAAKRSADLTRQLLAFARQEVVSPQVVNLNEAIAPMLQLLRRLIGEDIDLVWKPAATLPPIHIDPSQVDQLLANLSVNARDAIAGVGTLVIETSTQTLDADFCAAHAGLKPGPCVLLTVSDNGCGMDKETAERIFEPFFTTKSAGEGTGLGLSTVYGIVKQNDGAITVYSEPGQGTTFRLYFPALDEPRPRRQSRISDAPQVGGSETILLVEDEAPILRVAQRTLTRLGYTVLPAHTPAEAIELASEHSGDIDLMITDVVMPGMNGRDLATRLGELRPDLKVLFMSGYTADVIGRHGVLDADTPFIAKPFTTANLASKVREVLEQA